MCNPHASEWNEWIFNQLISENTIWQFHANHVFVQTAQASHRFFFLSPNSMHSNLYFYLKDKYLIIVKLLLNYYGLFQISDVRMQGPKY